MLRNQVNTMIKMTDFLKIKSPSALTPSPDGSPVAFDVLQPVLEGNRYARELWLAEDGKEPARILKDGGYAGHFFWTEPGRGLALQTVGETSTAVELELPSGTVGRSYEIPARVTAIYPLTEDSFAFTAAVSLRREKHPAELSFLDEMADEYDIIDEIPLWNDGDGFSSQKRIGLFRYRKSTGEIEKLTPDRRSVDRVQASDGVLLYQARTYERMSVESGLYRYSARTSKTEPLVEEQRYRIFSFCPGPDGAVYFAAQDKRTKSMTDDPDFYEAKDGQVRPTAIADMQACDSVSTDCRYGGGTDFAFRGGALYFLHTGEHDSFLMRADPVTGTSEAITPEGGSVSEFAFVGDRTFVVSMRGQGFSEVYRLEENGTLTPVTELNRGVLAGEVQKPERFTFENGGFRVNYHVIKPAGFDPAKKYPAILVIHGGAKVLYGDLFFHEMQFLAAEGYFVLYGNPRGSDGQGSKFADLKEHYGEQDFSDLMQAVDKALELYPNIDPERLGVEGGSYGGIMTNWCVTHTNRFKAAVAQRSICSMVSTFGTADNGIGFVREQMGGDLWNGFDKLWNQSPLKYADRCTTPLLLIHSTGDHRCDYSEAIQMFTALSYLGVESRVCLIHGESHGLSRIGHPKQRIKRLYEILRWFDLHLKETGE